MNRENTIQSPRLGGICTGLRARMRRVDGTWLLLVPFVALTVVWWLHAYAIPLVRHPTPPEQWLDVDFAVYFSAAHLTAIHGNPYDHSLLYATQRSILHHQWIPSNFGQVRAVYPPVLFWLLQPLTALPFAVAAWIWNGILVALLAGGFFASLRYLGWSFYSRRDWLIAGGAPFVIFFLMPQVQAGAHNGNVTVVLFAVVSVSLLTIRHHPLAGAALLGLAWFKPTLVLPVVLVILLFLTPSQRASLAGFALGTATLCVLSVLTCGWVSFGRWVYSLVAFWHDVGAQLQLSSLSGLYVGWASPHIRMALALLFLGATCALTAVCWLRYRHMRPVPLVAVAWLWVAWMLATPYAHFYDEILLTVPVLTLARSGLDWKASWLRASPVLYLLLFSFALENRYPHHINLLVVPVVGVAIYLAWTSWRLRAVRPTAARSVSG